MDNVETLKNSLELGLGCAILPESTVQKELQKYIFEIVSVKKLRLERPLGIICLNKKTFTKAVQCFYEMFFTRQDKTRSTSPTSNYASKAIYAGLSGFHP